MRIVLGLFILTAVALGTQAPATAQVTVDVGDSSAPWLGYMNVFELPANGGGYVFGSPWGVADLVAEFDDPNNRVELRPNSVDDPSSFWYTPSGGPGSTGNKFMSANLYQEVTGTYAGQTVTFNYDVSAVTTDPNHHNGFAFIKDFAPDYSSSLDMVVPLTVGSGQSISLLTTNDPARHVQFGFTFEGENVWITDVAPFGGITIDTIATPSFGSYSQDFNGLTAADPSALSLDGWKVFGEVFDLDGFSKFTYGTNPAPNGGNAFSAIASGEGAGGPTDQYLNTYSDYNCCDPGGTNEGHFDPSGLETVRSTIFQEFTISAADVGRQLEFEFDIKLPADPNAALGGGSTADVFIKTIDGGLIGVENTQDVTTIPGLNSSTWTTHTLTFDITSDMVGDLLQFGIVNESSAFEPTGVYLDNVSLDDVGSGLAGDFNGDGRVDSLDFLEWQRNPAVGNLADWEANYGLPVSSNATGVPEPSTILLCLVSCSLTSIVRRRSRV